MRTNPVKYFICTTLVAAIQLTGCATQQLQIDSNPEGSEVRMIDSSKIRVRVGVTPLLIDQAQYPKLFDETVQIEVSKEGFKPQSVLVPATRVKSSGKIAVILNREENDSVNETVAQVAQVQRLIYKASYLEAERMLNEAISRTPSIPTLYSLLGNVRYLQKNISLALEAYEKAKHLDPSNLENQKMIDKLRGMRLPAGGN